MQPACPDRARRNRQPDLVVLYKLQLLTPVNDTAKTSRVDASATGSFSGNHKRKAPEDPKRNGDHSERLPTGEAGTATPDQPPASTDVGASTKTSSDDPNSAGPEPVVLFKETQGAAPSSKRRRRNRK